MPEVISENSLVDVVHQIVRVAIQKYGSNQHPGELLRYLHWLYAVKPQTIVEVGVESGGTSWAAAQICPDAELIWVDMNLPQWHEEVKALNPRLRFFQGKSSEMADEVRKFYDPSRSIIFIDADHRYQAVVDDTLSYPGKIQLYHDIYWQPGNAAPKGGGADRFYEEHRSCCFIHEFSEGWAGIGVRHPATCKTPLIAHAN